MKYSFILVALFCIQTIFSQENSTEIYKKRVLETVEIDFISSYYVQNGENASVTGGIGDEYLTDAASTIIVSVPLNADDVLTIDAGISAYTSASSGNTNPFDDSVFGSNVVGSPWVASSGASRSDEWSTFGADYSHSSDDRNFTWNLNTSFSCIVLK